jgi:eukaryotic-like serine/threonine-protein kinase
MPMPYPSSLGHYEIIAPIGSGGMGEVYRARDKNLDRIVALKILPTTQTATGQIVRRFIQEAKAASALNHPNIAHIYEIGEADGTRFIAMELVEGQSLQEKISGRSLTGSEVVQIGCQVADALEHAHAARIIHRDIKSSNIMFTTRGQVKVLDFGLAKIQPHETTTPTDVETQLKTGPEVVMGTLPYMSPEQTLGQRLDHRSDIFSVGVVLYQLITGRLPFSGKTAAETANLITTAQPEPVARFNHDVSVELERIIRKCLEKEPQRRYQTAADLAADLENLKRDSQSSVSAGARVSPKQNRTAWVAAVAIILVVVALGAGYSIFKGNKSGATIVNVKSIAVLPFANVTGDQGTEYLSDGITESIINSLSQLPNMRVIARTTMFRYKGKNADPQTVGRELGVDAVVTGKAVQQGDTLVVQADLVNVADGSQIWGDRFNRKLPDLLAIQDEISRQIADKLRIRLSGEQVQLLTKRYTDNSEAYDLYRKGQFSYRKLTEPELLKSIDYYEQAIKIDPSYALAYVGIANSYLTLGGVLGFKSPAEMFPKAREAATRAISLDNQLANAHHALANCKLYFEWNWDDAERELKTALSLDPNYSYAHNTYGTLLQSRGLVNEAWEERKLGRKFDPLSPFAVADVGYPLYYARRYDEAITAYRESLQLDPNFAWGHLWIGQAEVQKRMYKEAIDEIKEAMRLSNGDIRMLATLGHAYAVSGNRSEAQNVLNDLQHLAKQRYVSPYFIAVIYVGLEEDELALEWLEKAYQERHPYLILLKVEPVFDRLRKNDRFIDLQKRVGINA